MANYTLGLLTLAQLEELAEIDDRGVIPGLWEDRDMGKLSEREAWALEDLCGRLLAYKTSLVNEATLWARAIYPILVMAERDNIKAYSAVPLSASFGHGDLRGEVDGTLARMGIEGNPLAPYLVVVEAKRGIEGHDPLAQLLGGLLCAARKNHASHARDEHLLYGVYTIADLWTFAQVKISNLDGDRPTIVTTFSREYTEKTEATRIVQLLRSIVAELLR